ncbi:tetratricopeptide repeat protein [candidate division KSB1 bacterium]|nr:tetratricopeptide repeat protein [candidate division KSB1 bacterium]
MAVFPFIDNSFHDSESWIGWAVAAQATKALQTRLQDSAFIYPPDWIWQTMDLDSSVDAAYLVNYAKKIGLDYVMLGSYYADCMGCPLEWKLWDVNRDSLKAEGKMEFPEGNRLVLGNRMADELLRTIPLTATKHDPTPPDEEIAKFQILAEYALINKQYKQAVAFAEKAFQADSLDYGSRNLFSRTHLEYAAYLKVEGVSPELHFAVARKISLRSVQIDSNNAHAYQILGRINLFKQFWKKAEDALTKALQKDPYIPEVYCDLSSLHISRIKRLGFTNKDALFRRALFINPCYREGYLLYADYLFFNNLTKSARKILNNLLFIYPRCLDGLHMLGKIAIAKSDIENVIQIYTKILDIDPRNVLAFYNLGVYYFNSEDLDHAEEFFNRAVRYGNHVDAHLYLGYIYETKGLKEKAIQEYRLRIHLNRGFDDKYADEARKRLRSLIQPDTSYTGSRPE